MHAPVQVVATLSGSTVLTGPGLGPELCHDRGPDLPHAKDFASVTVAHGTASVVVSG